jgi:diguanylate cyclase (GGDEF)-like protein
MKTIFTGYVLINGVCLIVIAELWRRNRKHFRGLGYWLAFYAFQFSGILLLALRDTVPAFVSVVTGNTLIIAGSAFLNAGLEEFTDTRGPRFQNWIILALFAPAIAYFTLASPNLSARNILFSASLLAICAQGGFLILARVPVDRRKAMRTIGVVFIAFCVLNAVRISWDLDVLFGGIRGSTSFDPLIIIAYAGFYLFLLFSLILLVNRRLIEDMADDMNARKKAEEVLRLRLRLWEFASKHDFSEIMQKALDEIEGLTDSKIGFFHFVEEDKGTLSLQAWSSGTIREFCHANAYGMTYDIEKAGIWADAVRGQRPVIHNDYATAPFRKGMPEGHAEVKREAVVPTMRNGKVVAVLGVGNKDSPYSNEDVELISYIADIVWTIVERERADERILELNAELERLAMTDELTGLPNRRAFFSQAKKEIARSKRHGLPCALFMMDLDGFKSVNDFHGHDAGDKILKRIAEVLRNGIRESDLPARLGGEEFTVLLPHTGMEEALILAERLRLEVERAGDHEPESILRVTVSIGVGALEGENDGIDSLLKRSDESLYNAKALGKNRVYPSIEFHKKGLTGA